MKNFMDFNNEGIIDYFTNLLFALFKFAIIREGFYSNKFACGEDFSLEYSSETASSDFLNDLKVIGKVLNLGF